jgi:hypothetical protein
MVDRIFIKNVSYERTLTSREIEGLEKLEVTTESIK